MLRKILGADSKLLYATKDWILLDGKYIRVDVQQFNQLLEKTDPASLDKAIQLYQGNLLEGCNPGSDNFDDWLFTYRNYYQGKVIAAIEKRLTLLLTDHKIQQHENYKKAIYYAMQLIKIDELQEYGYQALMIAYHKLGNNGAALRTYQSIYNKLQQQLSIKPSKATQQLYQKIVAPHILPTTKDKAIAFQNLPVSKKTPLSNKNERLLYQIDMAIKGVLEHKIGHSFLIRGKENKTSFLVEEMLNLVREKKFIYCHKKISSSNKKQSILVELLEVLTTYLSHPEQLKCLQKDNTISLRALSMLQQLSKGEPIMILIEHIHNSQIDLMVQLAEFVSLIANHAVLIIMIGNSSTNNPLEIIWQSAMIGAPLTTINI